MILEGIVTTLGADGAVNISPMGPEVDEGLRRFVLKPYRTATTYQNLKRTGQAIFHVSDDVELIAQAAVGVPHPLPEMSAARAVDGMILKNACRWYALRVAALDDSKDRSRIECEVVDQGRVRDFFGFNRGKHAVLEAAILATRLELLPRAEIIAEFGRLSTIVNKTGGESELRAMEFLRSYITAH